MRQLSYLKELADERAPKFINCVCLTRYIRVREAHMRLSREEAVDLIKMGT